MAVRHGAARLVVVQGDASRRELEIERSCEFGRGETCELVLLDGAASRRHARIEARGNDYYLVDLGSTNGTFINGSRVREAKLADGDEIAAGGVRLRFRSAIPNETMVVGAAKTAGPARSAAGGTADAAPVSPIGRNAQFLAARAVAERAAASELPILLSGETGTGKEVFAQYIHSRSPRAGGPMIALHAAAIPEGLLEAELFGTEKGAFTGSIGHRNGYITMADGGTLFLDEVGELPAEAQTKFLRVLETGEFHCIGSSITKKSDFRLVVATNRDLERAVSEGAFRRDLLFRLNAIEIRLPALRERKDDIPLLVASFLVNLNKTATPAFLAEAAARDWPGNIRELKHAIERAALLCDGAELLPEHLPLCLPFGGANAIESTLVVASDETVRSSSVSLEEIEKITILKALKKTGGRRGETARILGIAEPTLRRKLRRYGIETGADAAE